MTDTAPHRRRRSRRQIFLDWTRRVGSAAWAGWFVLYLTGSLLRLGTPRHVDIGERLDALPREGLPANDAVTIRWNDHHIPFIEAKHDADLAVGLGAVHAHLRLAQIDFMRRLALGRLAEVLGPMAVGTDHALRAIDFVRAGAEVDKVLPEESRAWLEAFRSGINWYVDNAEALPHEFQALGIRPSRWSYSDLLAVSRLASLDFTWKVWMRLLRLRHRPEWSELWERMIDEPTVQPPSVAGGGMGAEAMLGGLGRGGSNAYALAPSRTAGGGALIANDPHLSITMPNNWLIVGVKSPGHHAVGLMVPGVPVIGLGRSPWIAWGGTSLHGASSELVDVSSVPRKVMRTRRETIRVRWGRTRRLRIRDTEFGPVISDVRLLRMARRSPVALHWLGHRPSDEITPFLKIARARSWPGFLDALDGYAVPGLNMIYADREGRIGQAIAATLPRRPQEPPRDIVSSAEALQHWQSFVSSRELPHVVDPPEGFVASANNAPPPSDVSLSLFFSPDDRVRRLRQVLSQGARFTVDDMARLQTDVVSISAGELAGALLALVSSRQPAPQRPAEAALIEALGIWDGAYHADSLGALAFELLAYHLVMRLHGPTGAALYTATWDFFSLLRRDLERLTAEGSRRVLNDALAAAARVFVRHTCWGDVHRLRLAHAFAMLPGLGRRYIQADRAVGGSNETLMKTAHGFAGDRHRVRFGANARHISDMADPDANYFVLLGGQDGWLGSTTFSDQLNHWERGRHIRVPLRLGTVRAEFPHVTILRPGGRGRRQENA